MSEPTCDTSVLVPAIASWHEHHELARRGLRDVVALPAHVLFETVSVLSRLPDPMRISASVVVRALEQLGLPNVELPAAHHLPALHRLAEHGVSGGALYDGLVATTSSHHGLVLLTLDRRAERTYAAVGATYALLQA